MSHQQAHKDKYDVEFELSGFLGLSVFVDSLAKEHNMGNNGYWYNHFCDGFQGFEARLYGVRLHYRDLHAWLPRRRDKYEQEYHLASILFGMDSAIECFTFALNALGCSVSPTDFHNVEDDKALAKIKPDNVIGAVKSVCSGYAKFFPKLQQFWIEKHILINSITSQHDVSKHRSTTFSDGMNYRDDPPVGFWDALQLADEFDVQAYAPLANHYLVDKLKYPNARMAAGRGVPIFMLEQVVQEFHTFVQQTGVLAYEDAKTHFLLNSDGFVYVRNFKSE
ncbi:hypothetical protein LBMAG21_03710 [Armatimonadota bacterium]|nr:hypothetical protein LBMAG21_03710 [Armatimonadota bacterium]